jgi:hypothetical protein
MKFGIECFNVVPLSNCFLNESVQWRNYFISERESKFADIYDIFHPVWITFDAGDVHRKYFWIKNFVKIGAVEAILYLELKMNFCPYCPHLLFDLGEIRCRRLHVMRLMMICGFCGNPRSEGCINLTGGSRIRLRVYRETATLWKKVNVYVKSVFCVTDYRWIMCVRSRNIGEVCVLRQGL